jgi:hypothetical protein
MSGLEAGTGAERLPLLGTGSIQDGPDGDDGHTGAGSPRPFT